MTKPLSPSKTTRSMVPTNSSATVLPPATWTAANGPADMTGGDGTRLGTPRCAVAATRAPGGAHISLNCPAAAGAAGVLGVPPGP